MIRLLVNALGTLILVLALVFAVGDIARFLAQDEVRLTGLGDAMGSIGVSMEPAAGTSDVLGDLLAVVAPWPAAPALGAVAFLVLLVGRPRADRRRRALR